MTQHLAPNECRCTGANCALKDRCLRHSAMQDMARHTPWTERYCPHVGEEDGFIQIEEAK